MKKPAVEASAVNELITQLILSRPDISFRYLSNGKVLFHSPGDGQLSSAVHTIYGGQALSTMRKVDGHMNGIVLKGYVGIGDNARGNRSQEMFFINRRVMQSQTLSAALEQACRERVMIGKFPVCALHIGIPFENVDVNVHPNKLQVRFRDEAAVSEAVLTLVLEALKDRDAFEKPVEMLLTRDSTQAAPSPVSGKPQVTPPSAVVTTVPALPAQAAVVPPAAPPEPVFREIAKLPEQYRVSVSPPVNADIPAAVPAAPSPAVSSVPYREEKAEQVSTILPQISKPLKIFGALFNTFILIEYEDHLLLIDQHAVHERLLFDRLMQENRVQNLGQELLVPVIIPMTRKEIALIEENRNELESIGLVIESFGEKDVAVRTIPMVLGEAETTGFVRDIVADLDEKHALAFEKKRAALLQTACKHAVKGGEELSEDQLRSLVEEMIEKKVTPTCPHGRPLVVSISHRELDRKFKRIQN